MGADLNKPTTVNGYAALKEQNERIEAKLNVLLEGKNAQLKPSSNVNNGVVNNITVEGDCTIYPGWPPGWKHHGVDPAPFEPPSFSLSLADLEAAAKVCPAAECERGEPEATAPFLVELIRRVHSDPTQRNMYPNPNREDQVLTSAMRRWEMRQLVDAMRIMYGRIGSELGDAASEAPEDLQKLASGAQSSIRKSAKRVLNNSKAALSAHLSNLRVSAEAGEDWLGPAPADPAQEVRLFGYEWRSHLNIQSVVYSLESELGLTEAQGADTLGMASQFLVGFARTLIRGQPKNLTVILLSESTAAIRVGLGWQKLSAQEAAGRLVANIAQIAANFIRKLGEKELTPSRHLLPLLQGRRAELAELVGRGMLQSYAAAARAHFQKMPPPQGEPSVSQQAKALLEAAQPPRQLTLEDVLDLFGV